MMGLFSTVPGCAWQTWFYLTVPGAKLQFMVWGSGAPSNLGKPSILKKTRKQKIMLRFFPGGTKICNDIFRIGVDRPPLFPK